MLQLAADYGRMGTQGELSIICDSKDLWFWVILDVLTRCVELDAILLHTGLW